MDLNRAKILGDVPQTSRPNMYQWRYADPPAMAGEYLPRSAAPVDTAARALPPPAGGGVPPSGRGAPPGGGVPPSPPPPGGQRALPSPRDPWTGYPAPAEAAGKGGLWQTTKNWAKALGPIATWDLASSYADKAQLPLDTPLVPGINNRAVGLAASMMMPWLMRAEKLGGVVGADPEGLDAASKARMEMGQRGQAAWNKYADSAAERSPLHYMGDAVLGAGKNALQSLSPFGGAQRRAEARDKAQNAALDAAIQEEADNIAGYDRNKSLRAAAELRRTSPDIQTETVTYDENGNLKVTPGGERGAPGVLGYYNASNAKYSQNGNTAKVDFGQGKNSVEFDVTQAPAGAAERIQHTIANNPEFYRQGKKYVDDGGYALPEQNDLNLRTRAAQGGGMSYGQNPEVVKQARLESYAKASDLINQTRAVARGLDPRLAGQLDKQRDGTLRAASRAMRQQDMDGETFAQELALKRAGLRQAAPPKPEKKEKAQDLSFNNLKQIVQDEKLAGRIHGHFAEKGIYLTNPTDAAKALEYYKMASRALPPELAEYNPLDFAHTDMKSPSSWAFWKPQTKVASPKSGETYSFDDMDPELYGRLYSQQPNK